MIDFILKQSLIATYIGMGVMVAGALTFFGTLGYMLLKGPQ